MDEFSQVIQRVTHCVMDCLQNGTELDGQLSDEQDAVLIKCIETKILFANKAAEKMLSSPKSPLGRTGGSFLAESLVEASRLSDAMLLNGCNEMQFDHNGHDAEGRPVQFRTYKRSLLGEGHPTMAILCVSRVLEIIDDSGLIRLDSLTDSWKLYSALDDFDKSIAIGVGLGISAIDLGKRNGVTKKTIENHRSAILKVLGLENPIELVKLLVRFEENGFGDFSL